MGINKELLAPEIMNQYNYAKVKNKIEEVFHLFDYLKTVNEQLEIPAITSSGLVRYEQQVISVNNSKLENFVLMKIIKEIRGNDYEQKKLLSKIALALKKLKIIERKVFNYTFYNWKSEYEICEELNYSERTINEIRKSACIRFLIALNIDYMCLKEVV